jgi:hypothetical protein
LAAVFEVFFGCDVVCKCFRTLTIFSNFLWWSSNIRRVSGVSVKIRVRPYCLFFCFWLRRTWGLSGWLREMVLFQRERAWGWQVAKENGVDFSEFVFSTSGVDGKFLFSFLGSLYSFWLFDCFLITGIFSTNKDSMISMNCQKLCTISLDRNRIELII